MDSKEFYLSQFNRYHANGAKRSPRWLSELRESAMATFQERGFPTLHDEDWRYTNLDRITSVPFAISRGDAKPVSSDVVADLACADLECNRLVFVNGRYDARLSAVKGLAPGIRIENLGALLDANDDFLESRLGRYARIPENPFMALNTALMTDGALVVVPKNCRLETPLHLIYVSVANGAPVASYPRNLLVFEAGSEAQVVENYIGLNGGTYFANAVTELIAEEGASVEHYRLEREAGSGSHIGALEARIQRNCNFTAHAITLGGGLVRNDVHAVLAGEGSECTLNGLYLLDDDQHLDNSTEIEHVQPRATSLELYKGILTGSARGVFNGKILVHKDAQKTNARQTNKNLLLSPNAVVNTKPQLEIHADDVKCSHGSTIGELDRDALFYLRSRGIGMGEARSLLSYAFANEVVARVRVEYLRRRLDDYLLNKLGRIQNPVLQ